MANIQETFPGFDQPAFTLPQVEVGVGNVIKNEQRKPAFYREARREARASNSRFLNILHSIGDERYGDDIDSKSAWIDGAATALYGLQRQIDVMNMRDLFDDNFDEQGILDAVQLQASENLPDYHVDDEAA